MSIPGADFFGGLDTVVRRPIAITVGNETICFYKKEIYILPAIDLRSAKLGVQTTYTDALDALSTHYPSLLEQESYLMMVRDELIEKFKEFKPDPKDVLEKFNRFKMYYCSYKQYDQSIQASPPQLMSFEQAVQKVIKRNEVTEEEARQYVADLCNKPKSLPLELLKLEQDKALNFLNDLLDEGLVKIIPFTQQDYEKHKMQVPPPHTFELQDLLLRACTGKATSHFYKGPKIKISSKLFGESAIAKYLAEHYKSNFESVKPETYLPQPDITEGLGLI